MILNLWYILEPTGFKEKAMSKLHSQSVKSESLVMRTVPVLLMYRYMATYYKGMQFVDAIFLDATQNAVANVGKKCLNDSSRAFCKFNYLII